MAGACSLLHEQSTFVQLSASGLDAGPEPSLASLPDVRRAENVVLWILFKGIISAIRFGSRKYESTALFSKPTCRPLSTP